tara:strand:+ start:732 stop:950 length:219 start_codon:yes stop_codon:yes gene_type:complete
MKLEIDSQVIEATKMLILSEIDTYQKLYNKAQAFDSRAMIESSICNLQCAYSNLEINAKKPKPIRKLAIGTK